MTCRRVLASLVLVLAASLGARFATGAPNPIDYTTYMHWVGGTALPATNPALDLPNMTGGVVILDHPFVAGRRVAFVANGIAEQLSVTPVSHVTAIDITDPTALTAPAGDADQIGDVSWTGQAPMYVAADPRFADPSGNYRYLYVANMDNDLVVIKVSGTSGDPALTLTQVATMPGQSNPGDPQSDANAVALQQRASNGDSTFAFVYETGNSTFGDGFLRTYSVKDPEHPTLLNTLDLGIGTGGDIALNGDVAYISTNVTTGKVVNISNPYSPGLVGALGVQGGGGMALDSSRHLLFVNGANGSFPFRVLDVSTPGAPTIAYGADGTLPNPFEANGGRMTLVGNIVYTANDDGLIAIDVTAPSSPQILGTAEASGLPAGSYGVAVDGTHAYVSSPSEGLEALDITNPNSPAYLSSSTAQSATTVAVSGNTLVTGGGRFQVFDVTNDPPALLATGPHGAGRVALVGDRAYMQYGCGFRIYDLTNPTAPTMIGEQPNCESGNNGGVLAAYQAYQGPDLHTYVYQAYPGHVSAAHLLITDATDPAHLQNVGSLPFYGSTVNIFDVQIVCDRLYVSTDQGLSIFSLTNPGAPASLGTLTPPEREFTVVGNYVYALSGQGQGLDVIDASNPATPAVVATVPLRTREPFISADVWVKDRRAYVAYGNGGMFVIDVNSPTNPHFQGSVNPIRPGDVFDAPGGGHIATGSDVVVANGRAYLADGENGLYALPTHTGGMADLLPPTPPLVITAPADISFGEGCPAAIGSATASGGCGVLQITHSPAAPYPAGTTVVTWTVTDAAGSIATATQTVTVSPYVALTITPPPDVTYAADCSFSGSIALSIGSPTTTGGCPAPTITNNAPATFPAGLTVVTWTASDGISSASTTQRVTVNPPAGPTISLGSPTPTLFTGSSATSCQATVTLSNLGTVTATDGCQTISSTSIVIQSVSPAPISVVGSIPGRPTSMVLGVGVSTIVWAVTDSRGLTATSVQNVTIADNTLPTLAAPANLTVSAGCATSVPGSSVDLGTPTYADNCPGVTVSNNAPASYPVGITTVTWTATDAAGNVRTALQRVTVNGSTPGTLAFSGVVSVSVPENAGSVSLNVVRTNGACGAVSVTYATADGTALTGRDYTGSTGTLSWADGDVSARVITIPILDNTIVDGTRTFTVALSAPTGGAVLGIAQNRTRTVNILDDDVATAGTIAIAPAALSVMENAGNATVTLSRTGGSSGSVSVSLYTTDGTALNGTDYSNTFTPAELVVSWADGDAADKTFSFGIIDNSIVDGDRNFTIGINNPTGGATLGSSITTVTIQNDDVPQPGTIAIAPAALSVMENGGSATVTLSRTGGSDGAVSVSLYTANGTALNGTDYANYFTPEQLVVSWAAGDASDKTFSFGIIDNSIVDGDRDFTIGIYNPTGGATLGSSVTTVTIHNDDGNHPAVIDPISDVTLAENTTASVPVHASDVDGDPLSLSATLPGFATLQSPTSGTGDVSTTIALAPGFSDAGSYTATVSEAGGVSVSFHITVTNADRGPALAVPASVTASERSLLTVDVSASDPDGEPVGALTADLSGLPAGNDAQFTIVGDPLPALTASGRLTWTPTCHDADGGGDYAVAFTASNALTATATTAIHVTNVGSAAVLAALPNISVAEGTTLVVPVDATDADGDIVTLEATVPAFATFVPGSSTPGHATATISLAPGYSDAGSYPIHVSATQGCDAAAEADFTVAVTPTNRPPVIDPIADQTLDEASTLDVAIRATDADGDIVTMSAALPSFATLAAAPTAGTATGTIHIAPGYSNAGDYTATVHATDAPGAAAVDVSFAIHVNNIDRGPVVTAPSTQTGSVGVALDFTVSASDPDGDAITSLTASTLPGGATFTPAGDNLSGAFHWVPGSGQSGNYSVTFTAANALAGSATTNISIMDVNAAPVVAITGPATGSVYPVGAAVALSGSFTDEAGDTHTARWTLDATSITGTVDEGAGTVSGSYSFMAAGVYNVTLTVTDNYGHSGSASTIGGLTEMIVVYDPSAGFVTGGGTINSPAGAYAPSPTLAGKANFGFVSKYKKGQSVPTGETEFEFKVGNFNFYSDVYEWLVVSGARAQYKGTGTVNGIGNYGFILTAIDGGVQGGGGTDKFRIKIWNNDAGGAVVYDNQMGASDGSDPTTVIASGSIVIHTSGSAAGSMDQAARAPAASYELSQNYPNPFNPSTAIAFSTPRDARVRLAVFDSRGRLVAVLVDEMVSAGRHEIRWDGRDSSGRAVASGMYYCRYEADGAVEARPMLLLK